MQRRGLFRGTIDRLPNTLIQGVATSIPDKTELANRLNINVSDIGLFTVEGNDIKANIKVNYNLPNRYDAFKQPSGCISFVDLENKITSTSEFIFYASDILVAVELGAVSVANQLFQSSDNIKKVYFPNATSIGYACFYNCKSPMRVYIPKVRTFTGGDVFYAINNTVTIYADPFLQTSNGGAEDSQIAYARGRGATIIYVSDFTKPSEITDLSYTTNGTDVTLTFTPPSSTNTLDFYEVYVNGFYKEEISGSGAVISGLSNGDKVTVYACDEYYNISISNEVTISGI
jgi:hypothetical protein